MKKSDFIVEVAKKSGLSQVKAGEVVNTMLDVITEALKSGDKVTLTGFGTFEVRERAARVVTDIRTREKRQTPASKHPAFSSGAVLKAAVSPRTVAAKPAANKASAKTAPAKSSAKSKGKKG